MDLTSRFRQVSAEVYHAVDDLVTFGQDDVRDLKAQAVLNPRHRARFCAHRDVSDVLQDMLIVHPREAYIRPHMHLAKPQTHLILEGQVLFILFDQSGNPTTIFDLAAPPSDYPFFIRIPKNTFYTMLINSEWLTFLEQTVGPFDSKENVFASWSPAESDASAVCQYRQQLLDQANSLKSLHAIATL